MKVYKALDGELQSGRVIAVSYTHLDVYKRQLPGLRDILSRSWLVAVLPLPGYSFSDGHPVFKVLFTDELTLSLIHI